VALDIPKHRICSCSSSLCPHQPHLVLLRMKQPFAIFTSTLLLYSRWACFCPNMSAVSDCPKTSFVVQKSSFIQEPGDAPDAEPETHWDQPAAISPFIVHTRYGIRFHSHLARTRWMENHHYIILVNSRTSCLPCRRQRRRYHTLYHFLQHGGTRRYGLGISATCIIRRVILAQASS
jgi:hypothetical protein